MTEAPLLIKTLDVLVHPYFFDRISPRSRNLSPYKELIQKWDERMLELAQIPDAALIYWSCLRFDEHFPSSNVFERNKLVRVRAVDNYRKHLGRRLVLLPEETYPCAFLVPTALAGQGLIVDPEVTRMQVYGESLIESEDGVIEPYGGCVPVWGLAIKDILNISDDRYTHYTYNLSMTAEKAAVINHLEFKDGFLRAFLNSLLG